jgi:hypothetical protein
MEIRPSIPMTAQYGVNGTSVIPLQSFIEPSSHNRCNNIKHLGVPIVVALMYNPDIKSKINPISDFENKMSLVAIPQLGTSVGIATLSYDDKLEDEDTFDTERSQDIQHIPDDIYDKLLDNVLHSQMNEKSDDYDDDEEDPRPKKRSRKKRVSKD